MKRFKFPIAVAITSLALVMIIGIVAALAAPIGAIAAQRASSALWAGGPGFGPPWMRGPGFGPHGFGMEGFDLPPELRDLGDLPASERFSHFVGMQVILKDKDNRALTVQVTPGTATAVSANSLTITANDGSTKSFTLDDKSIPGGQQGPARSDKVVIVTLNNETTARAVINGGKDGFAGGPWSWGPPWVRR